MSYSSPVRLPRSIRESPNFDPGWRSFQVSEYLRCNRRAGESGETFAVPLSERDPLIRAFYKFRTDTPTPKAASLRWAQECEEGNDRTWIASRVKALTVAGVTATEISTRLHTCPENIETFQKLFFDVADYVNDHSALGAILLPRLERTSNIDPKERVWLLAAYNLGIKGLGYVMDQRVRLTVEEQREISDTIHCILAEQSLRYTFSLQAKAEAGPEVLDAYQKSQEMRARHPAPEDDQKRIAFTNAVVQAVKTKYGL